MPTLPELEAEIVTLEEQLRITRGLAEAMRAYEAAIGIKINESRVVTIRHRAKPSGRSSPAMSETEQVAADLMTRTGGPVATLEVVNEMYRRGLPVPATKPVNVISARLSNNPRFKGRRGAGYWFADRAWPGEADDAAAEQADDLGFAAEDLGLEDLLG